MHQAVTTTTNSCSSMTLCRTLAMLGLWLPQAARAQTPPADPPPAADCRDGETGCVSENMACMPWDHGPVPCAAGFECVGLWNNTNAAFEQATCRPEGVIYTSSHPAGTDVPSCSLPANSGAGGCATGFVCNDRSHLCEADAAPPAAPTCRTDADCPVASDSECFYTCDTTSSTCMMACNSSPPGGSSGGTPQNGTIHTFGSGQQNATHETAAGSEPQATCDFAGLMAELAAAVSATSGTDGLASLAASGEHATNPPPQLDFQGHV